MLACYRAWVPWCVHTKSTLQIPTPAPLEAHTNNYGRRFFTIMTTVPMQATAPMTASHDTSSMSLLTDSMKPPTGAIALCIISKYAYTVWVSVTNCIMVPPEVVVEVVNEVNVLVPTVLTVAIVE